MEALILLWRGRCRSAPKIKDSVRRPHPAEVSKRSSRSHRSKLTVLPAAHHLLIVISLVTIFACQLRLAEMKVESKAQELSLNTWASKPSRIEVVEREKTSLTSMSFAILSGRCTTDTYIKGSSYQYNVDAVLAKLVDNIDTDMDIWEEASDAFDNASTVYGVAGCVKLDAVSCEHCLTSIIRNLENWCPHQALSSAITLEACFLRYDNSYIKVDAYVHENGTPFTVKRF